jgi:hypothetical protein
MIAPFSRVPANEPSKGASPNVSTLPFAEATQYPLLSDVAKIALAGFAPPKELALPNFPASP